MAYREAREARHKSDLRPVHSSLYWSYVAMSAVSTSDILEFVQENGIEFYPGLFLRPDIPVTNFLHIHHSILKPYSLWRKRADLEPYFPVEKWILMTDSLTFLMRHFGDDLVDYWRFRYKYPFTEADLVRWVKAGHSVKPLLANKHVRDVLACSFENSIS